MSTTAEHFHMADRRPGIRTKRLLWFALLCMALLGLSGCVYLRLLEFKGQLSNFDENFSVDLEEGLSITFLNPVILQKDMWKIGLPPTIQETDPEAHGRSAK